MNHIDEERKKLLNLTNETMIRLTTPATPLQVCVPGLVFLCL
jgi:hypothetical protein